MRHLFADRPRIPVSPWSASRISGPVPEVSLGGADVEKEVRSERRGGWDPSTTLARAWSAVTVSDVDGVIDFDGEQFVVYMEPYDPVAAAAIKALHSRKWSPEARAWLVGRDKRSAQGLKRIAIERKWNGTASALEAFENSRSMPDPPPEFGVELEEEEGRSVFVIRFRYDVDLVSQMKCLPGRRFNSTDKSWRAPADIEENCGRLLGLVEGDSRFVVTEPARVRLNSGRSWIEQLPEVTAEGTSASAEVGGTTSGWSPSARDKERQESSFALQAEDFTVEGLGGNLYGFQRAGVRYLLEARRSFLADEMGLGKTAQALATLEAARCYPALVVCPPAVKLNWKHEATRWLPPHRTVSVVADRKAPLARTDVVIATYDLVRSRLLELKGMQFQGIVADESHYLKSREAKRTKAMVELAAAIPSLRLALSGTPFPKAPVDLASQLAFLGRLDSDFGGFWPFASRYCNPTRNEYGINFDGSSNEDELAMRLRATCYCRREKHVVLAQLPDKSRSKQWIELEDPVAYDNQDLQARRRVADLRSAQAADDPGSKGFTSRTAQRRRDILGCAETLRQECGKQKLKGVIDWLENASASGEAMVVFAHHREFQRALVRAFPKAGRILADDRPEARDDTCRRFQAGEFPLLVCSLKAAGIGITLTKAAHVVFAELDWLPATHLQAEDRLHRIGQERAVTAWYLLGEGSIDVQLLGALDRRWSVAAAVNTSVIDDLFDQ